MKWIKNELDKYSNIPISIPYIFVGNKVFEVNYSPLSHKKCGAKQCFVNDNR